MLDHKMHACCLSLADVVTIIGTQDIVYGEGGRGRPYLV